MDDITDFFRVYAGLMESAYKLELKGNFEFALNRYEEAIKLCHTCHMEDNEAQKKYDRCLQIMENDRER